MKALVLTLSATTLASVVLFLIRHAQYRDAEDRVEVAQAYNRVLAMKIDSLKEELGRAKEPTVAAEVVTKIEKKLRATSKPKRPN